MGKGGGRDGKKKYVKSVKGAVTSLSEGTTKKRKTKTPGGGGGNDKKKRRRRRDDREGLRSGLGIKRCQSRVRS